MGYYCRSDTRGCYCRRETEESFGAYDVYVVHARFLTLKITPLPRPRRELFSLALRSWPHGGLKDRFQRFMIYIFDDRFIIPRPLTT